MEVVLLERVKNLGFLGDKVNVKAGYARNFLIPHSKAVLATKSNLEYFEQRRSELEKKAADAVSVAEKASTALQALKLVLKRKTSEDDKLYGSVSVTDVYDAIIAAGATVEKRDINLPMGPIRALGEYTIEVHLHSDVIAAVQIAIEAE
jgi:large subunit ribosomal protein L9